MADPPRVDQASADVGALLADAGVEGLSRRLLDVHLQALAADDPESADVAMALALPRWFDKEIVAAVRGYADPDRDLALLDRLAGFSLVLNRRDGTFAYHDTVRHHLLEEWYGGAPDHALEINARLVAYHETRLADAEVLQRDLQDVGAVLAEANRARFAALLTAVRGRMLSALREAQYHSIAMSSEKGCEFLSSQCERLESDGRVSLCAELVRMARDDLAHLPVPTGDGSFVRRIEYWEARVASNRGLLDEALDRLRTLDAAQEGVDDQLRLWALLLAASAHQRQGNRQDCKSALEQAIRLIDETDPDPHNAPAAFDQLADLQDAWLELDASRQSRLAAAEKAREVGNVGIQISSALGLAQLSAREGDRRASVSHAFNALDLARDAGIRNMWIARAMLVGLLPVLGDESPWHLPTMHAELTTLEQAARDEAPGGQPASHLDISLEAEYADALRTVGLLTLAGEHLDRLDEHGVGDETDPTTIARLSYLGGELRREQGRFPDASARYGSLLDAPNVTLWDRAAGWSNKGLVDMEFDPAAAEQELLEAVTVWEEMGHATNVVLVSAWRAQTLAGLGRVDEAERAIATAGEPAVDVPLEVEAPLHEARAAIARARAEWDVAAEADKLAAAAYELLRQPRDQAVALWRAASALGTSARWDAAASLADAAAGAWRDMLRRDGALVERPPAMTDADLDYAAGVNTLFRLPAHEGLHRARAAFRAATDKVPDDPWYNLNLSYACAALGDWTEAQYAMDRVIAKGDPWNDEVLVARRNEWSALRERAGQEEGEDEPSLAVTILRKVWPGIGRDA